MLKGDTEASRVLKVRWCPLVERETGTVFVVSPRSGRLLALPDVALLAGPATIRLRRRERLRDGDRATALVSDDWEQGDLGTPVAARWAPRLGLQMIWVMATVLARFAPLDRTFAGLDRLARLVPGPPLPVDRLLDDAVLAEGARGLGPLRARQCLPRTLVRFFLLRRAGHAVAANIGIWVPTPMMHAWVSVGDRPLGEEREEVMHYQPCLRFNGVTAGDGADSEQTQA